MYKAERKEEKMLEHCSLLFFENEIKDFDT